MPRIGLLFAGQGAQYVGMAQDLAHEYKAASRLFEKARETAGPGLIDMMFDGPEDRLTRTEISQPAVFLHSAAMYRILLNEGLLKEDDVAGAAGLSLGEYSAFNAAGVFEFAECLELVIRRGRLMQQACDNNPGAMAGVLGMEEEACGEACSQASEETGRIVVVANLNSPGQVVISGETEAVEKASGMLKEKGARRVVPLKVAGAFHSPLMKEAAEGLKLALDAVSLQSPLFPVVANVTGEPVGEMTEVPGILERQLTGTVRFADCLREVVEMGAEELWEIGPGRVLSGLARRTVPGIPVRRFDTVTDVELLKEEQEDAG